MNIKKTEQQIKNMGTVREKAVNYSKIGNGKYNRVDIYKAFIAGYTACQEDQQKAWSESCKCSPNDKHGETWCCNHCGLPTACQEEDRWVPVSERLPEDVSTVIISDASTGVVTTGWHIIPEGWFTDAIVSVTHWKKLPNPPKK